MSDAGATSPYALQLQGVVGFNQKIACGVLSLVDNDREALFYISAHSGVIHDINTGQQKMLQGHSNHITCIAASADRRWIATADGGSGDSMVIVWDSHTGVPVKTMFNTHAEGVLAMDISSDSAIIAILGITAEKEQVLSLWEWTEDVSEPLASLVIPSADLQTCVRFHRDDPNQMVTNGAKQVFFATCLEDGSWDVYSPEVDPADFKQGIGDFTHSTFVPGSSEVISATTDGDVVVWDESMLLASSADEAGADGEMRRQAVKIIKLHTGGGISFMRTAGPCIVTGGTDGFVRFYDFKLRLVAWFDDLDNGPVVCVDFSRTDKEVDEGGITAENFDCEDFIFSTSKAQIVGASSELLSQVDQAERGGSVIVRGFDGPVVAIAAHPSAPVAVASLHTGSVHMLDTEAHCIRASRPLPPAGAMEYTPDARFIMCGAASSGTLTVLDAETLDELQVISGALKDGVTHIAVSPDGRTMATVDASRATTLFSWMLDPEARVGDRLDSDALEAAGGADPAEGAAEALSWVWVGSYKAHGAAVQDLCWGEPLPGKDAAPRLWSVGSDGYLVEYDVAGSTVEGGIKLLSRTRIARGDAKLRAAAYVQGWGGAHAREDVLLTADEQFKIKVQSVGTGQAEGDADSDATPPCCRKTTLGPTYGEPISYAAVIPGAGYMLYATQAKVIGLVKLPLDGNPARCLGMIAHPGEITGCAAQCVPCPGKEGQEVRIATAGGEDGTVIFWKADFAKADSMSALGGEEGSMEPFFAMLDGGKGGALHEEMVDYFYYAQLKTQGEDATGEREITGHVPFEHTAPLLRAAGYYPSEAEVADIIAELRHESFYETGAQVDDLTFDAFVRVFVNHRPVSGVGQAQIEEAFINLGAKADTKLLSTERLGLLLGELGEPLREEELEACVAALLGAEGAGGAKEGGRALGLAAIGTDVTPQELAQGVLGFAGDEEEGEPAVEEGLPAEDDDEEGLGEA